MNRRNRHEPNSPWKNAWDAAFDIRQETALTVQNNQALQKHASAIKRLHEEMQQAFDYAQTLDNNLRTELTNVLQPMSESIAQLEADMRINPDYPELTIVGVLSTHEQRLNKLEQMIGGPYAQSSTHSPTPQNDAPQKVVDVERETDNRQLSTHQTTANRQQPTTACAHN